MRSKSIKDNKEREFIKGEMGRESITHEIERKSIKKWDITMKTAVLSTMYQTAPRTSNTQ